MHTQKRVALTIFLEHERYDNNNKFHLIKSKVNLSYNPNKFLIAPWSYDFVHLM